MKTLISIDPGMSSGIAIGTYSDTEPYKLTHCFQVKGGVEGFLKSVAVRSGTTYIYEEYYEALNVQGSSFDLLTQEIISECSHEDFPECPDDEHLCLGDSEYVAHADVIVEKFTARGGANQGFAYRTKDLEPLRIEGAILAMGLKPTWVSPAQQYFSGGEGKAKKKQAQHKWLKEHGLYVAPKDVGSTDADDVRSAIAHSISFLRRSRHMPTINYYFGEEKDD